MAGQPVQSAASDARAAKEFADTETILDRLDVNSAGGVRDMLDAVHAIGKPANPPQPGPLWRRPVAGSWSALEGHVASRSGG